MSCPVFAAFRTVGYQKSTKYWWTNWATSFGHFVYTHCLAAHLLCAYWLFLFRSQTSFSFCSWELLSYSSCLFSSEYFLAIIQSSQQMIWFGSKAHECHILIFWDSDFWVILSFFSPPFPSLPSPPFPFPSLSLLSPGIKGLDFIQQVTLFCAYSLLSLPSCTLLSCTYPLYPK